MAYNDTLARRVRDALAGDGNVTEKKMFGGLAFLHRGLMFVGISDRAMMARVGKAQYTAALRRKHVRMMDFTGKPMQGYVFVDATGLKTEKQLRFWVDLCLKHVGTLPTKSAE